MSNIPPIFLFIAKCKCNPYIANYITIHLWKFSSRVACTLTSFIKKNVWTSNIFTNFLELLQFYQSWEKMFFVASVDIFSVFTSKVLHCSKHSILGDSGKQILPLMDKNWLLSFLPPFVVLATNCFPTTATKSQTRICLHSKVILHLAKLFPFSPNPWHPVV